MTLSTNDVKLNDVLFIAFSFSKKNDGDMMIMCFFFFFYKSFCSVNVYEKKKGTNLTE
jgi:hypothetical protein